MIAALDIFCEEVDFDLAAVVKEPRIFHETMEAAMSQNQAWLLTPDDQETADKVVSLVRNEGKNTGAGSQLEEQTELMTEMVQEEEEEKEEEKEKEQEIEIEKFIDHAYSREEEAPVPWPFASLAANRCTPFYPASTFALYKRQPLPYPPYILLSNNYFNLRWSGERRLRNTVMVLDWCPQSPPAFSEAPERSLSGGPPPASDLLQRAASASGELTSVQREALWTPTLVNDTGTLTILMEGISGCCIAIRHGRQRHLHHCGGGQTHRSGIGYPGSRSEAPKLPVNPTLQQVRDPEVQSALTELCRHTDNAGDAGAVRLTLPQIEHLLQSGALRVREDGRYFVGVSLAEVSTFPNSSRKSNP